MSQTEMICQIDKFCMIFCMQHTETLPSWKGVVEAGGVMEGYFRIQLRREVAGKGPISTHIGVYPNQLHEITSLLAITCGLARYMLSGTDTSSELQEEISRAGQRRPQLQRLGELLLAFDPAIPEDFSGLPLQRNLHQARRAGRHKKNTWHHAETRLEAQPRLQILMQHGRHSQQFFLAEHRSCCQGPRGEAQ